LGEHLAAPGFGSNAGFYGPLECRIGQRAQVAVALQAVDPVLIEVNEATLAWHRLAELRIVDRENLADPS